MFSILPKLKIAFCYEQQAQQAAAVESAKPKAKVASFFKKALPALFSSPDKEPVARYTKVLGIFYDNQDGFNEQGAAAAKPHLSPFIRDVPAGWVYRELKVVKDTASLPPEGDGFAHVYSENANIIFAGCRVLDEEPPPDSSLMGAFAAAASAAASIF